MDAAAVVALVAALVAVAAAVAAVVLVRHAQTRERTLDEELERGKAHFDEVVAREVEQRSRDLEDALTLARAESLSTIAGEERRITEERRRDVAERERDASARLLDAVTAAERRVEQRLAGWSADIEMLQDGLAAELNRVGARLGQLTTEIEGKIVDEADRVQAAVDEHRDQIARLRRDFELHAQEVAKEGSGELEQHSAERRQALHEVAERLRRRERELHEQIERELNEAMQRIGSQLGDVEHRQLEQLQRVTSREASRYAEEAAQQFDASFRAAREEAARRLGRELDLSVERFAREAEGVFADRIEHLADSALQRVAMRIEELTRRLDELGVRN
jgi:hypothetical protein